MAASALVPALAEARPITFFSSSESARMAASASASTCAFSRSSSADEALACAFATFFSARGPAAATRVRPSTWKPYCGMERRCVSVAPGWSTAM